MLFVLYFFILQLYIMSFLIYINFSYNGFLLLGYWVLTSKNILKMISNRVTYFLIDQLGI